MSKAGLSHPQSDVEWWEAAVDQAIVACDGAAREAMNALLILNEFLEREMEERVSRGYIRGIRHGRLNTYNG